MKFYTHKTTSIFVTDVKFNKNLLFHLRDVQFFLSEQICCCKMLKGSLFLGHTVFAYCHIFCIFQSRAHIAYFFPHKMAFSTAISISFVFLLPISIWLPTEWHHPCVWTIPVERDGVVGFKQSCTMFPTHIWCLCGPHIFLNA